MTKHRRFVWDGWLMLLELDALNSNAVVRKYTWGLDLAGLSGSVGVSPANSGGRSALEGAGGIGGLLAVHQEAVTAYDGQSAIAAGDYAYFYDGNGNVGQLIDISSGTTVARYEYDSYGGALLASGTYAAINPIRFSTKYFDAATGLYYYGYRYYSPKLGRWVNRDPLFEEGGRNVYGYVANRPTLTFDSLGLKCPTCCCVEDIVFREARLPESDRASEGDLARSPGAHNFTITAKLKFKKANGKDAKDSDCKFEWWEWSDKQNVGEGPKHPEPLKHWHNLTEAASSVFDYLPGHKKYARPDCEADYDVPMNDIPKAQWGVAPPPSWSRKLYILVRVSSSKDCTCDSPYKVYRVYQHLEEKGGTWKTIRLEPGIESYPDYDDTTQVPDPT